MSLKGNLDTIPLSDVLQWLSANRKTGILYILKRSGISKKVYFQDGAICSTASSEPSEYLGSFLISLGYINEEQLQKAMETQIRSGIKLGKILVSVGILEEEDLKKVLMVKAVESVYDLFLWDEGDFSFDASSTIEEDMVHISLDVTPVIFEGIRRKDDWARFQETIPNRNVVPVKKTENRERKDTPQDKFCSTLFKEIDGKSSIADLELALHSSCYRVMAGVFQLLTEGSIELAGEKIPPQEEAINRVHRKMLDEALSMLEKKNFEESHRLFTYLYRKYPSDEEVKKGLELAERGASISYFDKVVPKNSVLELGISLKELSSQMLTPEEGFLASRINGSWDINAILKISPMAEQDTLDVIRRLLDRNILRVKNR